MEDTPPSQKLSTRVAAKVDCNVVELPPLYNTIDPDKLDTIVESMTNGAVSFRYTGHEITVSSDGSVTLCDQPEEAFNPGVGSSEGT
jgi:hypothetical protein